MMREGTRPIVYLAAFLIWVLGLSSANAEIFSECAWRKISPQIHQEFITEFFKSPHEGDAVLYKYKDKIIELASICADRRDISAEFVMRTIFDQAAMEGAAAEVKDSMGIDRVQLDLAWRKDFDAAICLVKDVSHDYNDITFADDVCPKDNGRQRFLRRFKVSPKTDSPNAYRLMRYFIAKAYAEVDAMVISAHSESQPPLKLTAPKP